MAKKATRKSTQVTRGVKKLHHFKLVIVALIEVKKY